MLNQLPILYSYRRCPYAMRARMALDVAVIAVNTIEIDLRHKPPAMLLVSPKATVPVLCLSDGSVIDESLDIVRWALAIRDPDNWARGWCDAIAMDLLTRTDGSFKYWLDRYKYVSRYPEHDAKSCRNAALVALLDPLALQLQNQPFIGGDSPTVQDALIFPFVRQFAAVDYVWFESSVDAQVQRWLKFWVDGALFRNIMRVAARDSKAI